MNDLLIMWLFLHDKALTFSSMWVIFLNYMLIRMIHFSFDFWSYDQTFILPRKRVIYLNQILIEIVYLSNDFHDQFKH